MSSSNFNCRFASQGCKNNNEQGFTSERGKNKHENERCYLNPKSKNYGKDQKASEERQQQHINKSIKTNTFGRCLLGDDQPISNKPINNIKIQIKPKIKSEAIQISAQPTDKLINSNLILGSEEQVITNNNANNKFLSNSENNNQIYDKIWNHINSLPDNKSVIDFISSLNDHELSRINDLQVFINTPHQDILTYELILRKEQIELELFGEIKTNNIKLKQQIELKLLGEIVTQNQTIKPIADKNDEDNEDDENKEDKEDKEAKVINTEPIDINQTIQSIEKENEDEIQEIDEIPKLNRNYLDDDVSSIEQKQIIPILNKKVKEQKSEIKPPYDKNAFKQIFKTILHK